MHRHYCTLFDINYSAKGLALYDSLVRHSSEPFTLEVLALDDETFWLLVELKLANTKIIPAHSFEDAMNLGEIKKTREWREYCWTCASSLMQYIMLGFPDIDELTYLDSDIFFFSDPRQIFDEMDGASIGITPHRFNENTPKHVLNNGQFNVGIVVARNDEVGRQCIGRWAAQVREWCYDRREHEHQCGDQKYLDEWPIFYWDSLKILKHPGINLGPWAIANFEISMPERRIYVDDHRLIAYHFHEFQDAEHLTNWPLRLMDRSLIYKPYIAAWKDASDRITIAKEAIKLRHNQQQLQAERA